MRNFSRPPTAADAPPDMSTDADLNALRANLRELPGDVIQTLCAATKQLDITLMLSIIHHIRQEQPLVADVRTPGARFRI